jgi:ribosomal protein L37AE/L43A
MNFNYRDFYKSNKSPWKKYLHLLPEGVDPKEFEMGFKDEYKEHPQVGPEGAAKIAAQHLSKKSDFYTRAKKAGLEEKELNLEDCACDDGLPKRDDGSLDIEHDGRPIHLSKIIQVGGEFGNGPSNGELSGYTSIGVKHSSQGIDQSRDGEGVNVSGENDKETITAGGKPVESDIVSNSVGGKVVSGGGQRQGGPNTKGSIAGTPKGTGEGTISLQEAKTKLRGMVKEALKEIKFDRESGKWTRLTEGGHKAGCKCGFCANKGKFGKKKDKEDKGTDKKKDKKEIDENQLNEVQKSESMCPACGSTIQDINAYGMGDCPACMKQVRGVSPRNPAVQQARPTSIAPKKIGSPFQKAQIPTGGLSKLNPGIVKKMRENEVGMKIGPSYKTIQPRQYKVMDDDFGRTNQYDPEITEVYDEEEECSMQERYNELINARRNLSESEMDEMKSVRERLKNINIAKRNYGLSQGGVNPNVFENEVNMKIGPSYKTVQPRMYKTAKDDFSRTNQYKPDVQESGMPTIEPEVDPDIDPGYPPGVDPDRAPAQPGKPNVPDPLQPDKPGISPRPKGYAEESKNVTMQGHEMLAQIHKDLQAQGVERVPEEQPSREEEKQLARDREANLPYKGYHGANKRRDKLSKLASKSPLAQESFEKKGNDPEHFGDEWSKDGKPSKKVSEAGGQAIQRSSSRTVNDIPQIPKNRHRDDIDESKKKELDEIADREFSSLHDLVLSIKRRFQTITSDQLRGAIPPLFKRQTGWDVDPEALEKVISQIESGEIKD